MRYAGDISAQQSWDMLAETPEAQLIDVRTQAEWAFVGLPLLSKLSRKPVMVEWQTYPNMAVNLRFVEDVTAQLDLNVPLLFLCRSGARSAAAAAALTDAGAQQAYNIAGGFEGDHDREGHRGHVNGWKAAGLPWRQG